MTEEVQPDATNVSEAVDALEEAVETTTEEATTEEATTEETTTEETTAE